MGNLNMFIIIIILFNRLIPSKYWKSDLLGFKTKIKLN